MMGKARGKEEEEEGVVIIVECYHDKHSKSVQQESTIRMFRINRWKTRRQTRKRETKTNVGR